MNKIAMVRALVLRPQMSLLIAAGIISGCAVGPDYKRPDISVPERFQRQAAVEQRETPVQADIAQWWDGFGDAQLARYVALAQRQNLSIVQAAARVSQTRAMLGAATSALWPSGAISGQAARAYQSVETPLGQVLDSTPGSDRWGNAYEVNVGGSWELDIFGGLRRGREAALAEYMASRAGSDAVRLSIAAQTSDTYIIIRGLQARLAIAQQQIATRRELLSTINLLNSKGLVADREVWQAEGALAQIRASVPSLQNALDVALNALDVLLGQPLGTHQLELVDAREIPVAPGISGILSPTDLIRRRPDLVVAERRLVAANARIGAAMGEYYPKLSLSGLIGSASTASGDLFTSGSSQVAGVLGLRWRLFDFGRINAQIQAAKGQEAEALAAYRLAVLHASEDVENAFSALLNREEEAAILVQAVDSAGRSRGAAGAAYEKGVVSLIEVLQADEDLLRASDARAQAKTESARAAVAAFKALGGGWEVADTVAAKWAD